MLRALFERRESPFRKIKTKEEHSDVRVSLAKARARKRPPSRERHDARLVRKTFSKKDSDAAVPPLENMARENDARELALACVPQKQDR